ncbi:carboxypeptidase-like regulatory domain-containing protein [uncultured Methanobrevibacter sp.]|uniref:carboxypeptidase-like regulatory domain-containing protein n=1 Tax=uncultured Methanobrevibacter sp. TaxID=253161 RepID=UPI0025FF156E|nr:carboxypeptidase-like regulatory domain-containing protein [uncultured Methanobrevibacter sp.]
MSFKKICICLILIFCIIGAASAAEDVSTDVVDASDDAVAVDAVSEDVSDSLESVVEDEPVVDESAPAQDILTSSPLGDDPIIIFVNASKDSSGDGSSWDEAFGGEWAIDDAYCEITDIGIIYAADGIYGIDPTLDINYPATITFIGQGENTIFNNVTTPIYTAGNPERAFTFINLTIAGSYNDFGRSSNFINCTFLSDINMEKAIQDYLDQGMITQVQLDESGDANTYFFNFDNCEFKNLNSVNSPITLYRYSQAKFTNCTFDNIVADSIISRNGDFINQDGIYFYDCKFANCNVKGVVDIPGNIEIADYCAIENCDYDFDATTDIAMVDEYSHNYLNATKLKVVAVDSVVDISSSEKGVVVITLTDGANPIAGATVKYTVNGGDEQTDVTGEDGKFTISGLTGEVTIAVNYEGNDSFNPISDSMFFNFTEEPVVPAKVATKITAPKVSAVYNVAKKLVITLTDKDGKVLANKKVTVKVGTISKTLNTNAKGQVSLNVATLVPKTYTATVKFAGDDSYIASSVSPKVVVSKKNQKIYCYP